jgi:DNA polymerase III subunit epsilon
MTPILAYDTETSGLPLWDKPSEDPAQPRIIQLAAELFDDDTGNTLAGMNLIIKPDGWTIPAEIEELIGITNELALLVGVPIKIALDTFMGMWRRATLRCAHNESFDMRMVRIELMRVEGYGPEIADEWKAAPAFCTQGKSTKIINLPPTEKMLRAGRKHAKSPNLGEAYKFFTGKDLEGAHNAAVDLSACKQVYFGIKKHESSVSA